MPCAVLGAGSTAVTQRNASLWMPLEVGILDLFKVLMLKILAGVEGQGEGKAMKCPGPVGVPRPRVPGHDRLGAREWSGMHS